MDVLSKVFGSDVRVFKQAAKPVEQSLASEPRETFSPGVQQDGSLSRPTFKAAEKSKTDKILDATASPEASLTFAVGAILFTALAAALRPKR